MHRDHITAALPASLHRHEAGADGWPDAALPPEWAARILQRMRVLYGERFDRLWQGFEAGALLRHWALELGGLSPDQLGRGMRALATHAAPPTIPEFINLCRLDPRTAYYEALAGLHARERGMRGEWSDPAIYWATVAIGAFDLKTQAYRRLRARWQAALAAAQAAPPREPIPPAPAAQRAGHPPPASCADPASGRAPLSDALAAQAAPGPGDPKRWARRILARRAAGDPGVTPHQLQCARNALR